MLVAKPMIQTAKQYAITKEWTEKFRETLRQLPADGSAIQKLERSAVESQLEELEEQLTEYDARLLKGLA